MLPLAFIEGVGGPELMMILAVMLLLFGSRRLPDLARGFGKSIREFKKAATGVEEEIKRAMEAPPPRHRPAASSKPAALADTAATPPGDTPHEPSTE